MNKFLSGQPNLEDLAVKKFQDSMRALWEAYCETLVIVRLTDGRDYLSNSEFLHACVDRKLFDEFNHKNATDLYYNFFMQMFAEYKLMERHYFRAEFSANIHPTDDSTWAFASNNWSLSDLGKEVVQDVSKLDAMTAARFRRIRELTKQLAIKY